MRISPSSGSTFGGTIVTISGSNFGPDTSLAIGGALATNVTISSEASLTATTTQHEVGVVDVIVSSGGHSGRLIGAFTYVSPVPVVNTPPVIRAITAHGSRLNEPDQFADLGESLALTADVDDAETPPAQLTYEWSSSMGGMFDGTGAAVTWRAPAAGNTPMTVTVTLTVIKHYYDVGPDGLPIPKESRVAQSVDISVHDSIREVGEMSRQFLLDFSDSSITNVPYIMRNFSASCPEAVAETSDVTNNRIHFRITAYSVGTPAVTINFRGTCPFRTRRGDACAQVPVDWASIYLDDGSHQHVGGTDQVTALYVPSEGGWRLCGSDFDGYALLQLRHAFIR